MLDSPDDGLDDYNRRPVREMLRQIELEKQMNEAEKWKAAFTRLLDYFGDLEGTTYLGRPVDREGFVAGIPEDQRPQGLRELLDKYHGEAG